MKPLMIFDMDGVLLNSEKLYMDMNQAFFRQLGAPVSIDEHKKFVGISATYMWSYIRDKFALRQSVEELILAERELKYKMLSETELTPTGGVLNFLDHLKRQQIIASIASSSMLRNIELVLGKLGIRHYFDLVVSGEQVQKGKPDPDIFLKVAHYYGRNVSECIVIEDSTNGVLAAKAAGMTCIGYNNPDSGNQDLSAADHIIDSFMDMKLYDIVNI